MIRIVVPRKSILQSTTNIIFSLICILWNFNTAALSLDTFILTPSHLFDSYANSNYSSCYSQHNQLYTNSLTLEPPQVSILRDSDFTISIYFTAKIRYKRYLLSYNEPLSNKLLFGLYVTPGDSTAGISYNTCLGKRETIQLPSEHIIMNRELFFALSVSPLNSTHTILSYMVGNSSSVHYLTLSTSFKCSFPPEGEFAEKRETLTDDTAVRFIGDCRDLIIAGRSLTLAELELLRQGNFLSGGFTPTNCICPKGSVPFSRETCYDSQSDITTARLSLDGPRPELVADGNPDTYWQSFPYDQSVSLSLSFSSPLTRVDLIRVEFLSPPDALTLSVTSSDNATVFVAQIVSDCNSHNLASSNCISSLNSTELIPCCVTADRLGINSTFEILFSDSAHLRYITSISLLFSQLSSPSTHYSISEIEFYSRAIQNTTGVVSPTLISQTSTLITPSISPVTTSIHPFSTRTPIHSHISTSSLRSSRAFATTSFRSTPTLSLSLIPSPIQTKPGIRITPTSFSPRPRASLVASVASSYSLTPTPNILSTTITTSSLLSSSLFSPSPTPSPTAPPTLVIPPCTISISPLYLNITVPNSLGYKQFDFSPSSDVPAVSFLSSSSLSESDTQFHVAVPSGLSKGFTIEPTLLTISKLDYFVHSYTIWNLDPYFNLSLTAFDEGNSFNLRDTDVTVNVTLESDNVSLVVPFSKQSFTELATLMFPQSWFSTLQTVRSVLLTVTSPSTLLIQTTLSLRLITAPPPDLSVPTDTRPIVVIALPHFLLYTDSSATLSVHLLADTGVRYFVMRLNYPLNATIVNLDSSLQWEFSSSSNTVAISGFISLPSQGVTSHGLFDINLQLLSEDREISCELIQVFDEHFNPLLLDGSSSLCYFSGPSGLSPSASYLNIISESVTRIAAYPRQSIIYNHAVLSQTAVRTPIYTFLYTSRGVKSDATGPEFTCTSSNRAVIKIDASCSYLYFNGSELYGSDNVSISVRYRDLTTEIYVKVFYPDLPISLSLSDPILNSIPSFPGVAGCGSTFQSSRILAYTNFTTPSESVHDIDVLDLVLSSISLSDTNLARIREGLHLVGKSVGSGTIRITNSNGMLGETRFTVSNDPVRIACYSPHVYTDVEINSKSLSLTTTAHVSQLLEFSFPQRFIYNTTRGFSFVLIRYSDANIELVDAFNLTSAGVNFQDNTFILSNDTSLTFSLPTTCPLLKSLSIITPIRLQQPDDVIISLPNRILAVETGIASSLGFQTNTTLTAHLVFGSEMIEITNPFVSICIMNTNILELIYTDAGAVLQSKGVGTTDITVSVPQFSVTKHISIQMVSVKNLRSKLFISHSNSTQGTSVLSRVRSDVFQSGDLLVEALLTNSQVVLINVNNSDLTFEVREDPGPSDAPGPLTDKAYFIANRLYANSSLVTADANIIIFAYYFGSFVMQPVVLSNNTLSVVNLTNFDTIPDLNGVIGSPFLVNFGLTLSDGTFFPRYFLEGPIYPGLVNFELSDPSSTFFDPSNGMLTLIGNSQDLVSIKAEVGNLSVISNGFAVNLVPIGNYIDIGSEEGLALPHRRVNENFTIPIWLQAEAYFKSVDISLTYDSASLSINSIIPETYFRGGLFLSNSRSAGVIRLGGVVPLPLSGARLLIAEVELSTPQPQDVNLIGTVNSLSGPFPLYSSIRTANNIRLTSLTQVVTSSRSIRSSDQPSNDRPRVKRNQVCVERNATNSGRTICVQCSVEVKGDVNRDCKFDLSDVSYLLDYVTASYTGFTSQTGRLIKEEVDQLPLSRVDINEDGEVSISDVNYLNWVNFGLFYFFQSVQAELNFPAQAQAYDYDCELSVSANLMNATLSNPRFHVYLEVSQSSSLSDQFLSPVDPIQGVFVANTSREDVTARVYLTDGFVFRYIIPGSFAQDIGISPILVATDGNQFFYQALTNRSSTLNYPELRVAIPFPEQNSDVSVYIPGGYSPYFTYRPPTFCGALTVSLERIGEIQAKELTLHWPGTGGRGPFSLKKIFCRMIGRESNLALPCAGVIKDYQTISFPEFTIANLNPYSVYHFRMAVQGRSSLWTQFTTPEAAPESLLPPIITRYNTSCIYVRWEDPEKPNGVILNHTLFLNDTRVHVDGHIKSYLWCGVNTEGVHSVSIQSSNSAGSVRSLQIQATLDATVSLIRLNGSCVELNWTQLVFNATARIQEVFIISIDNTTIALDYTETHIIVCDLIADGTAFYLEISSSEVGRLFSGSLSLPISPSFPIYTLLLAVLIPILTAILLLLCCIVLGIYCWRYHKRGFKKITTMKPIDFWSTEEEFVEVSPLDAASLEQKLQFRPAGLSGRDRSSTFESSDSWMARDPLFDAEQGEAHKHTSRREDSFDSESLHTSGKLSDSSYNNVTMTSEDRTLSHITPRKAYSLRGRTRLSATPSDQRKVRMRHSWHNLRHKRFFKRTPSKLAPSKSASELYQNEDVELGESRNEIILSPIPPQPEDAPPEQVPAQASVPLHSEVYENPREELAETPFLVQQTEQVTPNILLKQYLAEEVHSNPLFTQVNVEEIPETPFSIQKPAEEVMSEPFINQMSDLPETPFYIQKPAEELVLEPMVTQISEEITETPFPAQEPTKELVSEPILIQASEEIPETPFSLQGPAEEVISKPILTQEILEEESMSFFSQSPVEELTSTPLSTQQPTEFFSKRFSTQETIEEVISEPLPTAESGRDLASTPHSTEEKIGEATILDFDPPRRRNLPARPSLDLVEGHVMDIAQGYETGDLPLEENRPHPMFHERSFTALPEEDSVLSRRSIFQSPGYQQSFLSLNSYPQSTDISEEPPTPDADDPDIPN